MCGLVGMVGFLEHKHKQAMKELLFLNTLRGKDSTGLSVVRRDRSVLTRKMTVPGYEFIEHPSVEKAMTHSDQLWMGHGRFKTTGDISKANAHPFEVVDDDGDVWLVGTHNGTLHSKWDIERKLKNKRFETDSEALFNWLVEAPNYKEAIKELRGAWSLVWWDPTENSLHFCRNKERPLSYAWTKDHKVLVWASEPWMIVNACRRNGVELEKNERGMSCYSTLEDYLYTLEIPQERDTALPDLVREGGYAGAPAPTFQNNWFGGNKKTWWGDKDPDEEREKQAAKSEKETEANGKKTPKATVTLGYPPSEDLGGGIRGFNGRNLSLKELAAIKEKGCVWCKDLLDNGTIFAFLAEESIVCGKCMNDRHSKGDCLRRDAEDYDVDDLDDPLPWKTDDGPRYEGLGPNHEDTEEYKRLIAASADAAKKNVG